MPNQPFFTVLVVAYNAQSTIANCLTSIISQSFNDFEIVFVNDCSSDRTLDVAHRILKNFPSSLCISNSSNIGLTASLNIGLSYSRGQYIARLDADDVSLPNRLLLASKLHLIGFDIVGSGAYLNHPTYTHSDHSPPESALYTTINSYIMNPFIHSSVSFRRLNNMSPVLYNEYFVRAQDFELWNRLHSYGWRSCFVSHPNCIRSNLATSISNKYYVSQRIYALTVRLKYYPLSISALAYNLLEILCIFYCLLGLRRVRALLKLSSS